MSEIRVEEVTEAELGAVAELHIRAFPESVLSRLGAEAVRRNYHWQLTGPHDLTPLVAREDGVVRGYLFGGVFRGSTIGFVKKEKWFLMRQVALHPRILAGTVGWQRIGLGVKLLTRKFVPPAPEEPAHVPHRSFGVLAIAVDPRSQGTGIGRRLMAEAEERAKLQGFDAMHLVVHPENERGVAFYRSLGWRPEPEGEGWTGRMTYRLSTNGSTPDDGAR